MRLLHFRDDQSLTYTEFGKHNIPPYAILSHTWAHEEVTFQDLVHGNLSDLSGYQKILFCAEQAAKDGLKYFWVDTCCIDKRNLPELTKAINSMFSWYRNSTRCYTYLSDVSMPSATDAESNTTLWLEAFRTSRWFTRGWTLQELLAPVSVEFFSVEGCLLGDKRSLEHEIAEITNISIEAIRGHPLDKFSASERFAWAEGRETTEEEDIAYCLLGIFNIFMPLIYGEGEMNALRRLKRLVDESFNDDQLSSVEEIHHHANTELLFPSGSTSNHIQKQDPTSDEDKEGKMRRKLYLLNTLRRTGTLTVSARPMRRRTSISLSPWHQALCLSQDVAQGANAGSIFQESHASFMSAVYWDEWPNFRIFTDRSDMMNDILDHCKDTRHSSRLLLACKRIDSFSLRWASFFTVVEFVMDIDPEWPNTVWSAIRLAFVRCKDFVNIFEKLAQMLDMMRQRLPSYYDHVLQLHNECPDAQKSHIGKALAFVYADILQFCQDVCALFKKSPDKDEKGRGHTESLFFSPFDARFHALLLRLAEHKGLFDIELRAGRHNSLAAFVEKVVRNVRERNEMAQEDEVRILLEEQKTTREGRSFQALFKWIEPPEYKADFEKAKGARNPGSCAWMLEQPDYVSWKTALGTIDRGDGHLGGPKALTSPPILWLEGPPGYGKTILSTAIIEDLNSVISPKNPAAAHKRPQIEVAYFYFNAQIPIKQSCRSALRTIAIQTIEVLQKDTEIIDLTSILMFREGGDLSKASDDELQELILLSTSRFSSLFIVLDATDECQDFETMWPFIATTCVEARTRWLLLSRPSTSTPPENVHFSSRQPIPEANTSDIWHYLHREARNLQDAELLPRHLTVNRVADILTSRAKSRFLWATLMMSYLRSPALSPAAREHEIVTSQQAESLYTMYFGMLRQSELLFSSERSLLTSILQVLVLSKEPQSIEQLNIAVSIKPGRKISREDLVPNISDTINRLCGPLIDIGTNSIVSFSHLSFRAFLLSDEAVNLGSSFLVDTRIGSLRLGAVCLSYLVNDMPQNVLSGLPDTIADKAELALQLPFLEYSVRYWVDHAVCALRLMPDAIHELISHCYTIFQQLGSFMSQKTSISAWIEACWTYGFEPSIENFWAELKWRLEQAGRDTQGRSISSRAFEALGQIEALSEDLTKLSTSWNHLLSVRPYEIWGASISAFLGPASWVHNDDANVNVIINAGKEEDIENIIFKTSRLSACGRYLGSVRLSHRSKPRNLNAIKPCTCGLKLCVCTHATSPVDLSNVEACYQILEMKRGFPIVKEFLIELDSNDLAEVEEAANGNKFRFPVAFSPNLQYISILRTMIWEGPDGSIQQQKLEVQFSTQSSSHTQSHAINDQRFGWRKGKRFLEFAEQLRRRKEHVFRTVSEQINQLPAAKSRLYRLEFSPCSQYVALVEREPDGNEQAEGRWTFTIWQNGSSHDLSTHALNWKRVALLPRIYGYFLNSGSFAFNPRFRMIAMIERAELTFYQTSIWNFSRAVQAKPRTVMVYATGLRYLHFSPCGAFLFGDHLYYDTIRTVPLESYLAGAVSVSSQVSNSGYDPEVLVTQMTGNSKGDLTSKGLAPRTRLLLAQRPNQTMVSSNTLTIATRNGEPELSTIRSYSDGAVVLKQFSQTANDEKCLVYLPDDMRSCTSVSILNAGEGQSDYFRMVLMTNFRDLYTWDNPLNRQSAALITRPVQSIQQYKVSNVKHTIAYEAQEISSLANLGAQTLLTRREDIQDDDCD